MVIRSLDIEPGARVLELGVGTGLSLRAYPLHCQLTGIDLAPDMLERAQDKVNRNGWRHVTLEQGGRPEPPTSRTTASTTSWRFTS